MAAWGAASKSCKTLLDRIEQNDPQLTELFILPTKTFAAEEVERLSKIIENGTNTNLKKLSASGHKLSNESFFLLGKASGGSSSLTSIAIGDNTMGYTGILALTKGLREGCCSTSGGCCKLEEIDLSYKGIGRSGLKLILSSFSSRNCPHLMVLNLRRNERIGENQNDENYDGGSGVSSCSFQSISHLRELDLSQCGLTSDFVTKFFQCLQPQQPSQQQDTTTDIMHQETTTTTPRTNLITLHIQENPLQSNGFKALLPFLVPTTTVVATTGTTTNSSSCLLQHLNVSHCQLDDDAIESWVHVATAAGTTKAAAGKAKAETAAATAKGEDGGEGDGGGGTSSLQLLDLSNNDEITSIGVQYLLKGLALSNQRHLMELNLANNTNIGREGVQILAQAMRGSGSSGSDIQVVGCLKKLDLTNTNCGVEGAIDIINAASTSAASVTNNNNNNNDHEPGRGGLQSLYLFNNNLGSHGGFISIAESNCLRGGHPTLQHLDLGGNGADEASVVVLLSSLLLQQQQQPGGDHEQQQQQEVNNDSETQPPPPPSSSSSPPPNGKHSSSSMNVSSNSNRLKVLVVGGNEGGDAIEQIVTKIQQVHPMLDIARDKKAAAAPQQQR